MSRIFVLLVSILCILSFMNGEVFAKRFGGGRSFGASRSVSSFSPAKNFSTSNVRSNASRWMGPLAGMVAGGLLASLFMHNGIGSGMMAWVALAAVGFFLFNMLRNRNQFETNRKQNFAPDNNFYNQFQATSQNTPNFNTDEFLRNAKVQFLRMQTAYDQKNLQDIRTFTTPEVFGEIQLQLNERGNAENITEVPLLNAELAQIDSNNEVASVRFHGMIKENVGEDAALFNETWHFQRAGSGQWLVAGIQQN